jgi:hypothetical protein
MLSRVDMKYVYMTLFLLYKADKISSVKVSYERGADFNLQITFPRETETKFSQKMLLV